MGGNFQQHQGVEFNNPPARRCSPSTPASSCTPGPAEQGALTVAIRHDSTLRSPARRGRGGSTPSTSTTRACSSRSASASRAGSRSRSSGSTGRATNDHLHFEVHVAPTDSVPAIIGDNRYPPYTDQPRAVDRAAPRHRRRGGAGVGQPGPAGAAGARLRTREAGAAGDALQLRRDLRRPGAPASRPTTRSTSPSRDVPPGEYVLGTEIEGRKLFRRVRVEAGKLTWVEFRP